MMKKMLCLVLSLMLLSCAALAEEEKEITFQGVPWGSSIEEMGQIWIDNGFLNEWKELEHSHLCRTPMEYLTQEDGIDVAYTDENLAAVGGRQWMEPNWLVKGTQIAGYDIKEIQTFWACNDNNSALLAVKVILKVDDKAAAYDDLTAKLTTVYGECENVEKYTFVNGWIGANNTAVLLTANDGTSCSEMLTERDKEKVALIYGTLDAQEILDTYYAEYQANQKPEPTVNPFDVSGL